MVGEAYSFKTDSINVGRGIAHRTHSIGADILPADIVDMIPFDQRPEVAGPLNAAGAALVDMVPADDMISGSCIQFVATAGFVELVRLGADLDRDRADLPDGVFLDDPVMSAVGEYRSDSRSRETVARLFKREPFYPDKAEPSNPRFENLLLHGDLDLRFFAIEIGRRSKQ